MVTCPMTSRDPKRSRSCPRYIWRRISRKRLEIGACFQWDTNRKPHMGYRIVTWRQVTLKGHGRDPNMFWAQYLPNSWRQSRLQWSSYRKSYMRYQMVTCLLTSRDPKRSWWWPHMFEAHYLENGWGYRFSYVEAPIRYLIPICLSSGHARWRHVTL